MIFDQNQKSKKKIIQIRLLVFWGKETEYEIQKSEEDVIVFKQPPNLVSFLVNMFKFDKGVFLYEQLNIKGTPD